MSDVVGPGFSITVSDVQRSAAFCEEHLGARRDPYLTPASAPAWGANRPRPGLKGVWTGGGHAATRRFCAGCDGEMWDGWPRCSPPGL
jgi:hypothetical protein